ncbi:esterase/lipase family protein [Amycolatopsis sp. NPDC059657]|uniref:esterase/lipase family protein n=1 Tax=Amycolatopsis sp. NPDC059657 TaxID=3346899 RepID=UPI00366E5449
MRRSALLVVLMLVAGLATVAPAGALYGLNDWSCRPSEAHPEPVVLVHGTGDNKDYTWRMLGPMLISRGYCAYSLTYGVLPGAPVVGDVVGGLTPIEDSSAELKTFIDRVLTTTGKSKVDIVGYSQGTLLPTYYAKFLGGGEKINRYISLAPLWNGTNVAGAADTYALLRTLGLGWLTNLITNCAACPEVLTGSDLLARMREGGMFLPDVAYTNIVTMYDQNIVPYTSGLGEGTNIVLQDACAEDHVNHVGMPVDPNALGHVLNALDPPHASPVPCVPMGPVAPRQ